MILPDSVFCEKMHEVCTAKSDRKTPRQKLDETVNKLAELLQQSGEPMDYFEISKALNLHLIKRQYSRHVDYYPERAKKCVSALIEKFPNHFEMTTVEKTKKNGISYQAPAVKAIPQKISEKLKA